MYRAYITAGLNEGVIIECVDFKTIYKATRRAIRSNTRTHTIHYASAYIERIDGDISIEIMRLYCKDLTLLPIRGQKGKRKRVKRFSKKGSLYKLVIS